MKLTERQERFCLEYAASGNGTKAYKAAGYNTSSDDYAAIAACKLKKKPEIQQRLAQLAAEMASTKIADAAEVQQVLTEILRGNLQEEVIVVESCGDGVSQASRVAKSPSLKERIKAGETLARMQGAFDSAVKLEMTIPVFGGEESLAD